MIEKGKEKDRKTIFESVSILDVSKRWRMGKREVVDGKAKGRESYQKNHLCGS